MKRTTILGSIVLTALAGCGGGGGGDGSATIKVSLRPAEISMTYPGNSQALTNPEVAVTATITGDISTQVYPYIVDSVGVLVHGAQAVSQNPDGSYTVQLMFNKSLAAGMYTGDFSLNLCKDVNCTSSYTLNGGTLPYNLTVTSGIQITSATVNGNPALPSSLNVNDGDVVALQSNVPVTWTTAQSGVIVSSPTSTSTLWSATLGYGLSTPGGTGLLSVCALTVSTPTAQLCTSINLMQ